MSDNQSQVKRVLQQYTKDEYEDMKADSRPCIRYYENKIKQNKIFKNQIECAQEVYKIFIDPTVTNVLIVGRTQSGKTGCILCSIIEFLDRNEIPVDNIFIVTGLSSNDWKNQMRDRFHNILHKNIMDRTKFLKNIDKISRLYNVLIIIDEVQIATLETQRMASEIKENLKHIMYSQNIKIIELSATPNGTAFDNPNIQKIKLHPGPGYISLYDIKNMGNTRQFKSLKCENIIDVINKLIETNEDLSPEKNAEIQEKIINLKLYCIGVMLEYNRHELVTNYIIKNNIPLDPDDFCDFLEELDTTLENIKEIFNENKRFDTSGYILIRTHTGQYQQNTMDLFKIIFEVKDYEYIKYDATTHINLNEVLKYKPVKTTIIFIKEMCRCSNTLTKEHINIVYERCSNTIDDSIMNQGLAARLTGYDYNCNTICFLNLESIDKQERLWESTYNDKTIDWSSNSTKMKNGKITSKGTINSIFNSEKTGTTSTEPDIFYIKEEVFYISPTESLADFNTRTKSKGSQNPFCDKKKDKSGFYTTSTTKISKVYRLKELKEELSGLSGTSGFDIGKKVIDNYKSDEIIQTRRYVCYTDTSEYNQNNTVIIKRILYKR